MMCSFQLSLQINKQWEEMLYAKCKQLVNGKYTQEFQINVNQHQQYAKYRQELAISYGYWLPSLERDEMSLCNYNYSVVLCVSKMLCYIR